MSLSYIVRRLLQLLIVLFVASLIAFFIIRLIPGDPASILLGVYSTPLALEALQERLGLDRPIWVQYGIFLRGALQGDMGMSYVYNQPVVPFVLKKLRVTLSLIAFTMILSLSLFVPFGTWAALKEGTFVDHIIRIISSFTLSLPSFWIALLLLLLFSLKLRWFPVSGYGISFSEHIWHLFLPALALSLGSSAVLLRNYRAALLETMQKPYVTVARSKGLPEKRLLFKHVLRNAVIPIVTILGVSLAFMIGQTVIVESIFTTPGIGYLLVEAIFKRDYVVIQYLTLVFAVFISLVNLVVDVSYVLLDPRITYK